MGAARIRVAQGMAQGLQPGGQVEEVGGVNLVVVKPELLQAQVGAVSEGSQVANFVAMCPKHLQLAEALHPVEARQVIVRHVQDGQVS